MFSYSACLCFLIANLSFRQNNLKFSSNWLPFRLTLLFKRDSINRRSLTTFMTTIDDLTVFADSFMRSWVIALYFRNSNIKFWISFFLFYLIFIILYHFINRAIRLVIFIFNLVLYFFYWQVLSYFCNFWFSLLISYKKALDYIIAMARDLTLNGNLLFFYICWYLGVILLLSATTLLYCLSLT